jgi:hypothetical protein
MEIVDKYELNLRRFYKLVWISRDLLDYAINLADGKKTI